MIVRFLILSLLIISIELVGQNPIYLGVDYLPGISKLHDSSIKAKPGVVLGDFMVTSGIQFNERISVKTGIGRRTYVLNYAPTTPFSPRIILTRNYYLIVPLSIQYTYNWFYIKGGVLLNVNIVNNAIINGQSNFFSARSQRPAISTSLSLGANIISTPNSILSVGPYVTYFGKPPYKWFYYRNIGVEISYSFSISRKRDN
jgi:hypothetical protein